MKDMNRRSFLRLSGGLTSGAVAASAVGVSGLLSACSSQNGAPMGSGSGQPIGLQLYTLRDVIGEDPKATLRDVASYGYSFVESYEGPQGVYWGMGNKEFKRYLDGLGMSMKASHVNNFNDFDSFARKVEEAAEIDAQYLICPYAQQGSLDDYRQLADDFNRAGEIARDAGIRFAYHNHGYTFERMDGIYPQDLLMENTDPDLVDYELDIYWLAAVNADPVAWMRKYPGRFKLGHVKDISRSGGEPTTTTLGRGELDWATILPAARAQGMEHFIVEQENYEGTTPLQAVEDGAAFLKSMRF